MPARLPKRAGADQGASRPHLNCPLGGPAGQLRQRLLSFAAAQQSQGLEEGEMRTAGRLRGLPLNRGPLSRQWARWCSGPDPPTPRKPCRSTHGSWSQQDGRRGPLGELHACAALLWLHLPAGGCRGFGKAKEIQKAKKVSVPTTPANDTAVLQRPKLGQHSQHPASCEAEVHKATR